ncbi:MAG: 50S ribosomal protein L21e [Promethearchaeota archaeon]
MMGKNHGYRRSTRSVFKKKVRDKGMSPLTSLLIKYDVGDIVDVKVDPSVHKGMPHRRFHGKTGRIIEKRGKAFVVEIRDKKKMKFITTTRDHFKPNYILRQKLLKE